MEKKRISALPSTLLAALILLSAFVLAMVNSPMARISKEGPASAELKKQLAKYGTSDRVYLQMDKSLYKPGETIWFQAYLTNVSNMMPSGQSDMIHVQMINPQGNTMTELKLIADHGSASGDFSLDENAPGGIYKIKAYTNAQLNNPEELLFEKEIQVQRVILPHLKMKMDFVKKAYGPGDLVEAKLELNSLDNKPLANFDYTYEANIDGKAYKSGQGVSGADGKFVLSFNLPEQLNSPDGLLNVIFKYNGQPEAISRSIPITLNKISMKFFPEGGDMVAGIQSRIAFKAMNEFNKPADVDGYISDEKGTEIVRFSSLHMGMGAFTFNPLPNKKYTAHISRPTGITTEYVLPAPLKEGYSMRVDKIGAHKLRVHVSATEGGMVDITAMLRDKIYFSQAFKAKAGENYADIPLDKFPMGVAIITLSDAKGVAQAERLAFVNKQKNMHIKLSTDKEKYAPREKVKLRIEATDANGKALQGRLSLAVVDDKLLSMADDRTGTILSRMLLEPELKNTVEEPGFYFKDDEAKADEALDNLLMTDGWRRFAWIKRGQYATLNTYTDEQTIISGTIKAQTNKGAEKLSGVLVKLKTERKTYKQYTDANGNYSFHPGYVKFPITVSVSDTGYTPQPASMIVYDYRTGYDMTLTKKNQKQVVYRDVESDGKYKKGEKTKVRMYEAKKMNVAPQRIQNMPAADMQWQENVETLNGAVQINAADQTLAFTATKANAAVQIVNGIALDDFKNTGAITDIVYLEEEANGFVAKNNFARKDMALRKAPAYKWAQTTANYYRGREFPVVEYKRAELVEERTDFRSTIFWKGNIRLDKEGKAELSFYNSDEETAFRATVEGISNSGLLGHAEKAFYTEMPFSLSAKIPQTASTGDQISLSIALKNNTSSILNGNLTYKLPASWKLVEQPGELRIAANSVANIILQVKVLNKPGKDNVQIAFHCATAADAIKQEVITAPKGFPSALSFSGNEEKAFAFNITKPLEGTLSATFKAYPSVLEQTMAGLESILNEPSGCFEQVSSSNYPNILVLQYLKENRINKPDIIARASRLLHDGYGKLVAYETTTKGYEWFGHAPANESLTAYGLLEFNDMKGVYSNVDNSMVQRTGKWLLSRKNGKGDFSMSSEAVDQFGRASQEITNAYIVYALAEAEYNKSDYTNELETAYSHAMKSGDPYEMGLVANALLSIKDKRGTEIVSTLKNMQQQNGSWPGKQHSITHSTGTELDIEATSLVMMAIMKDKGLGEVGALMKGTNYLLSKRQGVGGFGNTQTTVMALKALNRFAALNRVTRENGTIEIYVDGKVVGKQSYTAGQNNDITITGMESALGEGAHKLEVKYPGVKNPLPYAINITWSTNQPESNNDCKLNLTTSLSEANVKLGQTVRLNATMKNSTNEGLASPMLIIGIPAGLSLQPWQLKELQEKNVFDYYEIWGNNLVCYYRQMKPGESKTVNLDLKADIMGSYEAPASRAYLYYNSGAKSWSKPGNINIQ